MQSSIGDRVVAVALVPFLSVTVTVVIAVIAGWITHIVVCIQAITGGGDVSIAYGLLLLVGVFMPPVGVIHGIGVWVGAW